MEIFKKRNDVDYFNGNENMSEIWTNIKNDNQNEKKNTHINRQVQT